MGTHTQYENAKLFLLVYNFLLNELNCELTITRVHYISSVQPYGTTQSEHMHCATECSLYACDADNSVAQYLQIINDFMQIIEINKLHSTKYK